MLKRHLLLARGIVLAAALCFAAVTWAAAPVPGRAEGDGSLEARIAASFVGKGQEHLKAGRFQQAVESFTDALNVSPTHPAARKGLVQAKAGLARIQATPASAPVSVPKPLNAEHIRIQAKVSRVCMEARAMAEASDHLGAAQRYLLARELLAPIAGKPEVADLKAEVTRGLQAARDAAKVAAERAAATERAAKPPVSVVPVKKPAVARPAAHKAAEPVLLAQGPASEPGPAAAPATSSGKAELKSRLRKAMEESLDALDDWKMPEMSIGPTTRFKPDRQFRPGPQKDITTRPITRPEFQEAGGEEAVKQIQAALVNKTVSVNFEDTPFVDAIKEIKAVAGVNIVVDPRVQPIAENVTISLNSLPLKDILYWVLKFQGYGYKVKHGTVFVSDKVGLSDDPIMIAHDISDLTVHIRDFNDSYVQPVKAETWGLADKGDWAGRRRPSRREVSEAGRTQEGRTWEAFIKANVAPSSWRGEGSGAVGANTIAYRNGKLVVTQTPEVQDQIRELLASFRKARAVQVAILARFIEINEDFIEDLGIEWTGRGAGDAFGFLDTRGSGFFRAGVVSDTEVGVSPLGHQATDGLTLETGFLHTWEVQAIITAVKKKKKGNILTAPRVTCFNTQQAFLTVSTRRNFVRTYDSDGNPEIGQVNDGIIFQVQPFVSADRRYITLELQPQTNSVIGMQEFAYRQDGDDEGNDGIDNDGDGLIDEDDEGDGGEDKIQLPEVTVRQVMTTVSVPDGGTLMIGGLAQATEAEGYATVPILGDIPLIKHLFTSRTSVDARNNLIVLVTAHIIQQEDE